MSWRSHDLETRHKARVTIHTLRSTLTWLAASLMLGAFFSGCTEPPKPGNILVVQPGDFETKGDGKLFRVDPASGARSVLSDFSDTAQGVEGVDPFDVAVEPSGYIPVTDPNTLGEDANATLFRVDPKSGARTLLSDFGNPEQGPEGVVRDIRLPFIDVAVETSGHILVTAIDTGTDKKGVLFRVEPTSGVRHILTDFGDTGQGPLGQNPNGVAVATKV